MAINPFDLPVGGSLADVLAQIGGQSVALPPLPPSADAPAAEFTAPASSGPVPGLPAAAPLPLVMPSSSVPGLPQADAPPLVLPGGGSLEQALAQMSGAAETGDRPPAGRDGGGGGFNIGVALQQIMPFVMAAMAGKQGGRGAAGAALQGYLAGAAKRRQEEQARLQAELAAATSDEDRKFKLATAEQAKRERVAKFKSEAEARIATYTGADRAAVIKFYEQAAQEAFGLPPGTFTDVSTAHTQAERDAEAKAKKALQDEAATTIKDLRDRHGANYETIAANPNNTMLWHGKQVPISYIEDLANQPPVLGPEGQRIAPPVPAPKALTEAERFDNFRKKWAKEHGKSPADLTSKEEGQIEAAFARLTDRPSGDTAEDRVAARAEAAMPARAKAAITAIARQYGFDPKRAAAAMRNAMPGLQAQFPTMDPVRAMAILNALVGKPDPLDPMNDVLNEAGPGVLGPDYGQDVNLSASGAIAPLPTSAAPSPVVPQAAPAANPLMTDRGVAAAPPPTPANAFTANPAGVAAAPSAAGRPPMTPAMIEKLLTPLLAAYKTEADPAKKRRLLEQMRAIRAGGG